MIQDVDLSKDKRELTYQQDSFSVTATVVSSSNIQDGHQYVIYTSNSDNYYAMTHYSEGRNADLVYGVQIDASATTGRSFTEQDYGSSIVWTAHRVNVQGTAYYTFYFADVSNYTQDISKTPTIHYVDEEGNELEVENGRDWSDNYTSSPAFLIYDIDGYDYVKTTLEEVGGSEIRPILKKFAGNWQYTTSTDQSTSINWSNIPDDSQESNRLEDIYVVYKKAPEPVTGGTPKVKESSATKEPATPGIHKDSTPNGDGTNTLSLSITGDTSPLEVEKLTDVIVIFDTSTSMRRHMGTSTTTYESNSTPVGEYTDQKTRMWIAADAVNSLAETLIGDNTEYKDSAGNKLIRMSLISFNRNADIEISDDGGFTDNITTYKNAVNGLTTEAGTNWEYALDTANHLAIDPERATFVIFVTDGNPSYRTSRGNMLTSDGYPETVYDDHLDVNTANNYYFYRSLKYFGALDENDERNYNTAVVEAQSIVAHSKNLYCIGIGNDDKCMRNQRMGRKCLYLSWPYEVVNGTMTIYEHGHDFTVTENVDGGSTYHWELTADIYCPMVITDSSKGYESPTTVMLKKVSSSDSYDYAIDGGYYKIQSGTATLTATNIRRSNLNLVKQVVDSSGNVVTSAQLFEFTISIDDPMINAPTASGQDIWFSVQTDPNDINTVIKDLEVTGAFPEINDDSHTGFYYIRDNTSFTVKMQPGWNLRFTNLPTGATYSISESDVPGYSFVEAAVNNGGTFSIAEGTTGNGVINKPNTQYTVTYKNQTITQNISIWKTDLDHTVITTGASFALYSTDDYDDDTGLVKDGATAVTSGTTGENGILTLGSLAVGEYRLVETQAPAGYSPAESAIKIFVTADDVTAIQGTSYAEVARNVEGNEYRQYWVTGQEDNTWQIRVWNNYGATLPSTGGTGTNLIYLIGFMFTGIACTGLVMRKRQKNML